MPWVLTRGKRRRRNRLQGGRLHLGTVADIKSERWPTSSRNRWPACVGIRTRGTNAVLHPWLRERLSAILAELPPSGASQDVAATQAAWAVWQAGLTMPFTLPHDLPPLRLLLVWDNLTGHKTPDLVLWLCAHGIMPLYTPVGGSWLNMAE